MAKSFKFDGHFSAIPDSVIHSSAYRDLKPAPKALLLEFLYIHRPRRNGKLSITKERAIKLLNVGYKVASRAFYELAEHGIITLKAHQNWYNSLGREWAITFLPVNDREPTNEYKQWKKGVNMCPDAPRAEWLKD